MHEKTREQLLEENADSPSNQEFIRNASTPSYQYLWNVDGRRIIKTHLPFSMLPPSVMGERAKVSRKSTQCHIEDVTMHRLLIEIGAESRGIES